ncbi:MAG: SCO family protein [Pyrinomonadaceae bacterium]
MRMLTLAVAALLFCSITGRAQTTQPNNAAPLSTAEKYFSNTELMTQDGKRVRFYADVLKGKVIVINAFFSTCKGVCMPMNRNLKKVADILGDKVGRDVFLVSITVDPQMDKYVADKNDHTTVIIMGNERTGLWKKAFGLARAEEIAKVVESVINDKPTTTP